MITTFEPVNIVWNRLNESSLKTAITGGIYKQKRPQRTTSSNLEDIVVNSLPIVNNQLQECVLNVNLHVPNLVINTNGSQDRSQPNYPRLEELTRILTDLIEEVWTDDAQMHYQIQQQVMFEEEAINEHGVNFRLNFYSTNI